jgi:nucleoside-diphosphate-sugar epimerase
MKILITGGAGFIGSHLSKFHLSKGDEVLVVDNFLTGNQDNLGHLASQNLKIINRDVSKYDFMDLSDIDYAYSLASPASPVQYKKYPIETMLANSQGTFHLMEALKQNKIKRVVIASTSEVYGDPLEHPQVETYFGNVNPAGERSCYDESKRFSEAMGMTYFMKYKADIRIARIFNTYGPNMELNDGRVVSNFITQALQNKDITIYGNGKQTRSFCYVSDLVEGLSLLQETDGLSGEIINLGNPTEKTVFELATIIKKMVLSNSEIIFKEIGADDPKKRRPEITKAVNLLKWEPKVSLEDGLNKTIDYFRSKIV